jgi:DNA ligase (NAD+)
MDKNAMAKRVVELAELIQYHADLYYNKAKPEITDAEYDAMVDELKVMVAELERIDKSNQAIAKGKEALNNIGVTPSYGKKVTHSRIMGSLAMVNKGDKFAQINDWYNRYSPAGVGVFVTPKIDGCAVRLNFVDGKLVEAATRGNGTVGQDVTDNVMAISSIPKFIGAGKTVEVRGEMIMPRSVFKQLMESGERAFANPRNGGTGSLMVQDPKITARRGLELKVYDVIVNGKTFETEREKFAWMATELSGFDLASSKYLNIEEFSTLALEWEGKRPTLDYEIDGLVIAIDSIEAQEEAGWNGKDPNGKLAFKFRPEQAVAKVLGIDLQVGRTGRLTPMARIQPTLLAGSTISNITLHNYANVNTLDVSVGDEILIEKAGDIIPQVVRVVNRQAGRPIFEFENKCPSCGGPITLDEKGVSLWCESVACPAQLVRRVLHWVKTLDIMGVGTGIVEGLCDQGFIKDVPDLYYLSMEQIQAVTGGNSSAKKAQTAILSKSDIPLAVFLDALGIDGLGTTSSKLVAKRYGTLGDVMHATIEELDDLPDIGLTTAKKIVEGIRTLTTMIDRLIKVLDIQDCVSKEGPLKGMSFVLTGAMSKPRKEIEVAIERAGGENKGSVGKGVTFLVQADANSTSNKTEKANKVGTKVISEDTLWKMIG